MRSRKTRLGVIVEILKQNNISCQEELSRELAKRGYLVTQATLSRDLKKLKTIKIADDLGGYRYIISDYLPTDEDVSAPGKSTLQSSQHPAALTLRISGNIVIIKTRNGYAAGLAYDLDMLHSPYILGTIAGSDTVFAIFAENISRETILRIFDNFLPPEVILEATPHFKD